MNHRLVYLFLGGLGLCAAAFWFTHTYTLDIERVWTGPQGEARVDWLLAARLLLRRMGSEVQESSDLRKLASFSTDGTLLFAADHSHLEPARTRELLAWVKRGGHLVVAAGPARHRDPLLDAIGVHVKADDQSRPYSRQPDDVTLPDGSHVHVLLQPSVALEAPADDTAWRHGEEGKTRMLQIPLGDGLVTVMSTFRPFANRELGRFEHAELLWWLVSDNDKAPPVWLVRHLDVQSLSQWLINNALPFVAALILFLLLWLWRVIPRFGPIQPGAAPDRRSLIEHLRAMGRFYSMQRRLPALLQALRQDGLELLDHRAPETRGLDGAARLKSAARMSGLRARDLLQAFASEVRTPHEFTLATRTLAQFRQRLSTPAKASTKRGRAATQVRAHRGEHIGPGARLQPDEGRIR